MICSYIALSQNSIITNLKEKKETSRLYLKEIDFQFIFIMYFKDLLE